jgi:hypothetical protein
LADGLPACRFIGGQAGRSVCPHRLEACSPIPISGTDAERRTGGFARNSHFQFVIHRSLFFFQSKIITRKSNSCAARRLRLADAERGIFLGVMDFFDL